MELLQGDVRLTPCDGYVEVWHGRSATSLAELELILEALDAALAQSGCRRVLFDSRQSDQTPRDVGDRLWRWLEERALEKVGTLVTSSNLAVSVRMTGVARKVRIRAFDDERDAVAWLTT